MLTVVIGWMIINIFLNIISSILGLGFSLTHYFLVYVVIGYMVMSVKKIVSPLYQGIEIEKTGNPFSAFKKIELVLFFKDIYYASWWPYYLLRKKQ